MKTLSLLKTSLVLLCSFILSGCAQGELDLKEPAQSRDETIPFQRMYHCVWGWDGDCNGYYYIANRKAFIGMADMPDSPLLEDNRGIVEVYYI